MTAPPVTVTLSTPTNGSRVSASTATITGRVTGKHPTVLILGQPVKVAGNGTFSADVNLDVGSNLIDVIAGAPHAQPAFAAVQVVRYSLVAVPDISNQSPTQAEATLKAAGFNVKVVYSSNALDDLLPLSVKVCGISPAVGTKLEPGATVTLQTSEICL